MHLQPLACQAAAIVTSSNRLGLLLFSPGMFDGGQAATATRSDVSVSGSGSQSDVHRADRRMRSDSDSGQGLGGVFGIGVRSNSIGGEEPEDDDVSVLRFLRL